MDARARLIAELREHALVVGEVTLTSGATAQYYVDAKRAILLPAGFRALGELVAREAAARGAGAVGGMTMGADPVACSALAAGADVKAFFVRKERKEHGLQRWVEGPLLDPGERCLVVEDVVTTGGSTVKAIERIKEEGFAAAALALAACAPVAEAATVESGGLRATTTADPWHLEFTDARGRRVLAEQPGTGSGATGTLGFRTALGWSHATRVEEARMRGKGLDAVLATTDPLGRKLSIRLEPAGQGIVRLRAEVTGDGGDVTATGIAFEAPAAERYLGFGERSNAVDQRGNEVENYVAEGPYQPEERPFLTAFVPPDGYHPRDDATYFPMPWLVSTAGYGVLVDDNEPSWFRLGSDQTDAWSLEVEAPRLELRVFAGPRPADVVRRLTERIGRQPRPRAPWVLGPWFHTGQANEVPLDEEARYVGLLRQADAPVSAAETHLRYLPCGEHRDLRDYERERTRRLHDAGLAAITYFNSELCEEYEPVFSEAAAAGVLQKRADGSPYVFHAYVGSRTPPQTPVGQFDFTAPAAFDFYARLLDEAVADGHDGWMEDFGEYTPLDSHHANGMTGEQMHNWYPVSYHRAAQRYVERSNRPLSRHVRSGWTGSARHSQVVWGGDPTTDWGFDGLLSAVYNGLTMGLSGVSTWGSDIGGFFSLGTRALTPELLIRWIQFGAVSGVMRTKPGGVAIPPKPRPQIWEPGQIGHWRRWAKFRTQLYPYLVAADEQYQRTGMPIMRHMALVAPADPRATVSHEQFGFGPDLLAAPVLSPGATRRAVYVPRGRWVDVWRSVRFLKRSGALSLRRARSLRGGRAVELPAPLAELPLLARAGAVIPLLPPEVDTLATYGKQAKGLVRLADRRARMRLLAFPRGRSSARVYRRERVVSRERRVGWSLAVRGSRRRRYELQASLATLRRPFRPCALRVGRRRLARRAWRFDRRTRVLRARFATRQGKLTVQRRC
jgi:orotate phosphoribosyltransferase